MEIKRILFAIDLDNSIYRSLLIPGRFSPPIPRRAPEGLDEPARRGAAGMPLPFGGLGIALPKTPFKPFGAQDQSGIGVSFLLDTFLWTNKEKYLDCRAETRLQI